MLEAAVEVLRAREHVLARLAEAVPIGVLQVDTLGRVVLTNDRLHDILGCPRAATLDEQLVERRGGGPPSRAGRVRAACWREGLDDDLDVTVSASPPSDGGGTDSGAEGVDVRHCTFALRALTR